MSESKNAKSRSALNKIRRHFFDLSADGVLIYTDPFIGRLQNSERQMVVHYSPERKCFELRVQGRTIQEFALADDAADACQRAFEAYFRAFQEQCISLPRTTAAGAN